MSTLAKEISQVSIENELKQSYLDYAMSVIVGRALPDVRDGLKPVHRRVLYAMHQLGNEWNKTYKKSARVVGDVIGKYHPHGEGAVYDTLVRMAQSFSLRYPLVDGQGNFGSIDGDSAAAMRYTEVRMAKITQRLLADLEKDTVDFVPNYDGTEQVPTVFPTQIPNLLVNGSAGIAVGMATNIPPHHLGEVCDACLAYIDDNAITIEQLMTYIPGPDFPTAGIIHGKMGIWEAYKTGRGRIIVRARVNIETDEKTSKQTIIVTELPYQVNKARLIEKIAEIVKEKRVEGITELRDESDKDGMRVVIELRRGEIVEVVLNNLYMHTQLQVVYGINIVALTKGQPRTLNLKDLIVEFIHHRRDVVMRRTLFDLNKARDRAHIIEGLGIALANIDEMIALIKKAPNPAEAKTQLLARVWSPAFVKKMLESYDTQLARPENLSSEYGLFDEGYRLSPEQAQAILDLRLHRLTALEQDKIFEEFKSLLETIADLIDILGSETRLLEVIRTEIREVKQNFNDKRLTEIQETEETITLESLITQEDVVVTLSHEGYVKYQPLSIYRAQHRGGRGKSAMAVKEEDFVERLLLTNTHDTILCFSSIGKVYWMKVYELPQATRQSRGKPIVNLLPLSEKERITAILPIREFAENQFIVMATKAGTIKKTALTAFSRPRSNGIIALDLSDDDSLIGVEVTDGSHDIMLFTNAGKVIRFEEKLVRGMGRNARGVRGVKLQKDQTVIALIAVKEGGAILTATENGYGKRTPLEDYRVTGRGGQGVISIQVTDRNGKVVRAAHVLPEHDVMLITNVGTLVRIRVDEISLVGRNTQGVRLIQLSEGEKLVGLQRIEELNDGSAAEEVTDDTPL